MNVGITGATGFVGKSLVKTLLLKGHSVRILGRNENKAKNMFGDIEFFEWETGLEKADEKSLLSLDCLIHLAGEGISEKRWSQDEKDAIFRTRIEGTRNLVKTINSMGGQGPRTFICASAIGFYGDRKNEVLVESSSRGNGFLADVCEGWEGEFAKLSPSCRCVSLRFGIVLGKDGGMMKKILPLFRMGLGGPVGAGNQWMSWIHLQDLTRLLDEVAFNPRYQGVVNAVSAHPVTNAMFAHELGKVLKRPAFFKVPKFAIRAAMGEMSQLVLFSQRVIPQVAMKEGFEFQFPKLPEALSEIVSS